MMFRTIEEVTEYCMGCPRSPRRSPDPAEVAISYRDCPRRYECDGRRGLYPHQTDDIPEPDDEEYSRD